MGNRPKGGEKGTEKERVEKNMQESDSKWKNWEIRVTRGRRLLKNAWWKGRGD